VVEGSDKVVSVVQAVLGRVAQEPVAVTEVVDNLAVNDSTDFGRTSLGASAQGHGHVCHRLHAGHAGNSAIAFFRCHC